MAIFISTVKVEYNTDTERFTASMEYCEPAPGVVIEQVIEGEGPTLSLAIYDLADTVYEEIS